MEKRSIFFYCRYTTVCFICTWIFPLKAFFVFCSILTHCISSFFFSSPSSNKKNTKNRLYHPMLCQFSHCHTLSVTTMMLLMMMMIIGKQNPTPTASKKQYSTRITAFSPSSRKLNSEEGNRSLNDYVAQNGRDTRGHHHHRFLITMVVRWSHS